MKTARELAEAIVDHLSSDMCHSSRSIALMQVELIIGEYRPVDYATHQSLSMQIGNLQKTADSLRQMNKALSSDNDQLEKRAIADETEINELKSELRELQCRSHMLSLSHP